MPNIMQCSQYAKFKRCAQNVQKCAAYAYHGTKMQNMPYGICLWIPSLRMTMIGARAALQA